MEVPTKSQWSGVENSLTACVLEGFDGETLLGSEVNLANYVENKFKIIPPFLFEYSMCCHSVFHLWVFTKMAFLCPFLHYPRGSKRSCRFKLPRGSLQISCIRDLLYFYQIRLRGKLNGANGCIPRSNVLSHPVFSFSHSGQWLYPRAFNIWKVCFWSIHLYNFGKNVVKNKQKLKMPMFFQILLLYADK